MFDVSSLNCHANYILIKFFGKMKSIWSWQRKWTVYFCILEITFMKISRFLIAYNSGIVGKIVHTLIRYLFRRIYELIKEFVSRKSLLKISCTLLREREQKIKFYISNYTTFTNLILRLTLVYKIFVASPRLRQWQFETLAFKCRIPRKKLSIYGHILYIIIYNCI